MDGGPSIFVKEIDKETRIPKGISENAKKGRIKFIIVLLKYLVNFQKDCA